MTKSPPPLADVVVTGLGISHQLGIELSTFWSALFDETDYEIETPHFDSQPFKCSKTLMLGDEQKSRLGDEDKPDLFRFGLHAARHAIGDSCAENYLSVMGFSLGTTSGGLMDEFSAAKLNGSPQLTPISNSFVNATADVMTRELGIGGRSATYSIACASSGVSIFHAFESIRRGESQIVLAGGCDRVRPCDFAGFSGLRAMSTDLCKPFDESRNGLVMGDGSAFLVLENSEHAYRRGAKVYARLRSGGVTSDAFHATAPDYQGIERAMKIALSGAELEGYAPLYINAHGTGTKLNDAAEINAINSVFQGVNDEIYVSSTKSRTGHMLGTAGAIEALITCMALRNNQFPTTKNTSNPDKEITFNLLLDRDKASGIKYALSNSLGFGGNNVCLMFSS